MKDTAFFDGAIFPFETETKDIDKWTFKIQHIEETKYEKHCKELRGQKLKDIDFLLKLDRIEI